VTRASSPTESGDQYHGPTAALAGVLDVVAGWLAPSRQARRVVVPDFVGEHVSDTWLPALRAGVRLKIVRLTLKPAPTDGLVVGQDPSPGVEVRRGSRVTLVVRHPDARPRRPRRPR
jgi:beta-lactam-binding protein with PASTA domain